MSLSISKGAVDGLVEISTTSLEVTQEPPSTSYLIIIDMQ